MASSSNMNITVSVPAGSTSHGDSHILCTPPKFSDFVIFFFSNYLAHAATIITKPGQRWIETLEVTCFALLLPISGLARALETIMTHAVTEKDQIKRAARAEALCMVVRVSNTSNRPNEPQWYKSSVHDSNYRVADKVYGQYGLKKGYILVRVPKDAPVSTIAGAEKATSYVLTSDYNSPKLLISFIQAVWAIVTLYRARGNQIDQYGYAAFGLTVAQYACMSIVNVFGNLLRPDYPSMYMIRTPIMEDAEKDGCYFIGDLKVQLGDHEKSLSDLEWSTERRMLIGYPLSMVLGLVPVAIVGALTGFKKQNSTPLERGFTMAWLAVSIVLGPLVRIVHWMVAYILDAGDGLDMSIRLGFLAFVVVFFGAPAIGGMVMVGLMIQDFGVCSRIG
jgi:hypothetical protein